MATIILYACLVSFFVLVSSEVNATPGDGDLQEELDKKWNSRSEESNTGKQSEDKESTADVGKATEYRPTTGGSKHKANSSWSEKQSEKPSKNLSRATGRRSRGRGSRSRSSRKG